MLGFKAIWFSLSFIPVCDVRDFVCSKNSLEFYTCTLPEIGPDVPSMARHYNVVVDTQHPTVETVISYPPAPGSRPLASTA